MSARNVVSDGDGDGGGDGDGEWGMEYFGSHVEGRYAGYTVGQYICRKALMLSFEPWVSERSGVSGP